MTRFCHICRREKPLPEFEEKRRCRKCVVSGRHPPTVKLNMPKGWTSASKGIPDLSFPTETELREGYEGEGWTATNGAWVLEILWHGNHAKYLCRVVSGDADMNPQEARTFNYPHEVVEWLEKWFTHLGRAKH